MTPPNKGPEIAAAQQAAPAEQPKTLEAIKQGTHEKLDALKKEIGEQQLSPEQARQYLKQLDELKDNPAIKKDIISVQTVEGLRQAVILRGQLPSDASPNRMAEWTQKWEQLKTSITAVGSAVLKMIARFLKNSVLYEFVKGLADSPDAQTKDLLKAFPILLDGQDMGQTKKDVEEVRKYLHSTAKNINKALKNDDPRKLDYDFVDLLKELKEAEAARKDKKPIREWLEEEATNILNREKGEAEKTQGEARAMEQQNKLTDALPFLKEMTSQERQTWQKRLEDSAKTIQELRKKWDKSYQEYTFDKLLQIVKGKREGAPKEAKIDTGWLTQELQKILDEEKQKERTQPKLPEQNNQAASAPAKQ